MTEIHVRPGTQLHGSSGARIVYDDSWGIATKTGDSRVGEQGAWLQLHRSPIVPDVYLVRPDGYDMQRLTELPKSTTNPDLLTCEIVLQLDAHIWSVPPSVNISMELHTEKVDALAREWLTGKSVLRLLKVRERVEWDSLRKCLTHGDPTYDNVMVHPNGRIILIDPIPATSAVPDLMAVDIGKIMQSLKGYEEMRYAPYLVVDAGELDTLHYLVSEIEWEAAEYWCIVHFLRAVPYMPAHVKKLLIGAVDDILRML